MVTGFETITSTVSEVEVKKIIPYLSSRLRLNIGEEKAVTASTMMKVLNDKKFKTISKKGKEKTVKITGPRFRQMIHYIRVKGLIVNLVANSKGYFVADKPSQVDDYIKSLRERENSFNEVRRSMERQRIINPL